MLPSWTNTQIFAQLDSGERWAGDTISYQFAASTYGIYGAMGETTGFLPLAPDQREAAKLALKLWDDLVPASAKQFEQEQSHAAADIEFGRSTTGVGYAQAYLPSVGSVWFSAAPDEENSSLLAPRVGRHGFATYVHEIGHALGLEHMGDYNGSGTWAPSSFQDSTVYSIMSYFGPNWGAASGGGESAVAWGDWRGSDGILYSPQTPMLSDVYAIQAMYGIDATTRNGDTVYGFHSNVVDAATIFDFSVNENPILTIFDAAGIDTIDVSGWSTKSSINLEPGSFSSFNAMSNNLAIAYSATIENAVGGSGSDTIRGNHLANHLSGGAGHDLLYGQSGDDVIDGGGSNDAIYGGSGNDRLQGGEGSDYLRGGAGDDIIDGGPGADTMAGGEGSDIFVIAVVADPRDIDFIEDFDAGEDRIQIGGAISPRPQETGSRPFSHAASATADRLSYDADSGHVFFDPDGSGDAPAVHFASIDPYLALTAENFMLVA